MAKILTGPLAAGLSGKLGPVVFHQTRFGQIVQSKARGRIYKTTAALTTKSQFGEASRMSGLFVNGLDEWIDPPSARAHKSSRGQFIASRMAATRGEPARQMPCNMETGPITASLDANLLGGILYTVEAALPGQTTTFEIWAWEYANGAWALASSGARPYGTGIIYVRQTPQAPLRLWLWAIKNAPSLPPIPYRFGQQYWLDVPAS